MRSLSHRILLVATVALAAAAPARAADPEPPQAPPLRDGFPAAATGLTYKDPATNIIIYVETDGRHVAAIGTDGKMLWRKDPFVDAGLQPYRMARPTIDYLGPARSETLAGGMSSTAFGIGFTSSQFGTMDFATGHFKFGGQD